MKRQSLEIFCYTGAGLEKPGRLRAAGGLNEHLERHQTATGPDNAIATVADDARTFAVERHIRVGRRVWHMALNGDESRSFTTNGISGDVTVVDMAARKAVKSIKVGRHPRGAACRP